MNATAGTPTLSPGAPTTPETIHAVVQAGATETRYTRTGAGSPVLLLGRAGPGSALAALVPGLAARHRVLVPEPPASVLEAEAGSAGAAHHWLGDLVEALGLIRPHLVADDAFATVALDFAHVDPERLRGLVLVRGQGAAPADRREAELQRSGCPLLVLPAVPGPDPALSGFLGGR